MKACLYFLNGRAPPQLSSARSSGFFPSFSGIFEDSGRGFHTVRSSLFSLHFAISPFQQSILASGAFMDGLLAVIFLGCVFYSGKVILHFVSHESFVAPRIAFLEAEVIRVVEEAERESVFAASLRDRVELLRRDVASLREKSRTLRDEVDQERTKGRRLQIALYKRRIRESRRVLVP